MTKPAKTKTAAPKPAPVAASDNVSAAARSATQIRGAVATKVNALIAGEPAGSVSVTAVNTATGAQYTAGATSGMWTASDYKLFILETLLLQHQQDGSTLSSSQTAQATTMIENSDNTAGYSLFLQAGGNPGLAAAAQTFGMANTVPGRSDPTFTTTSSQDYTILLKNLVAAKGPLDADSQAFALNLMRNVESDQRWGVGVIADAGTTFANKNGWLAVDNSNGPGEDDNNRWIVNSVGVVTVGGHQVLVAVMTQHQDSYQDGINLVQALATAVKPAVS